MKISVQTVLDLLHSIMHPLSPELVHHLQRTGLICWYLGNRAGFDSAAINNAGYVVQYRGAEQSAPLQWRPW